MVRVASPGPELPSLAMLRELNNYVDVHGNNRSVTSCVLRVAAAYVVLGGVAVAVHFIVTPLYHAGDAPFTLWHYMNRLIAPAVLVTVAASYAGKRRMDADGSVDLKRYLEVNTVFYGSVAAAIIYYWNWTLAHARQCAGRPVRVRAGRGAAHLDGGCRLTALEYAQRAQRYRLTKRPSGRMSGRDSGAGHETGYHQRRGGRRRGELDRGSR